jgi:hypothetical protein
MLGQGHMHCGFVSTIFVFSFPNKRDDFVKLCSSSVLGPLSSVFQRLHCDCVCTRNMATACMYGAWLTPLGRGPRPKGALRDRYTSCSEWCRPRCLTMQTQAVRDVLHLNCCQPFVTDGVSRGRHGSKGDKESEVVRVVKLPMFVVGRTPWGPADRSEGRRNTSRLHLQLWRWVQYVPPDFCIYLHVYMTLWPTQQTSWTYDRGCCGVKLQRTASLCLGLRVWLRATELPGYM